MRDVNRIKGVVVLLLLSFCFSSSASANEETEVGISFTTGTTEPAKPPRPIDVIPLTTEKDYVQATGRYPQTGEKGQSKILQLIGALCVAGVFWLFLLFRFKDEEEEDESYG